MHKDFTFRALWVKGRGGPWVWLNEAELAAELDRLGDTPDKFISAQWFVGPVRKPGEAHWSHFFLDIDDKQGTGMGKEYAALCCEWAEKMKIPENLVTTIATGTGGYHVWVSGHAFNAKASPTLTACWESIAALIAAQMGIPTEGEAHLDLSVYTVPRLMRVPGPRSDAGDCVVDP